MASGLLTFKSIEETVTNESLNFQDNQAQIAIFFSNKFGKNSSSILSKLQLSIA